jgi:hypothetical protein
LDWKSAKELKFSEAHMHSPLRQGDKRAGVGEICGKAGIDLLQPTHEIRRSVASEMPAPAWGEEQQTEEAHH